QFGYIVDGIGQGRSRFPQKGETPQDALKSQALVEMASLQGRPDRPFIAQQSKHSSFSHGQPMSGGVPLAHRLYQEIDPDPIGTGCRTGATEETEVKDLP
ncbi:MAG: hypothetical protein M1553_03975, partial [Firmicutes bacterium]|nr:hypothetical protein [Bacillota bacterium]